MRETVLLLLIPHGNEQSVFKINLVHTTCKTLKGRQDELQHLCSRRLETNAVMKDVSLYVRAFQSTKLLQFHLQRSENTDCK